MRAYEGEGEGSEVANEGEGGKGTIDHAYLETWCLGWRVVDVIDSSLSSIIIVLSE